MNMYEEKIKNILKIIDVITCLMALYELFIKQAISFGLFLTFIALILNLILWGMNNIENLKNQIHLIFDITEHPDIANRFFIYLTGAYIIIDIIALIIMFSPTYYFFTTSFMALTVIPICYSCLTLGLKLYGVSKKNLYGNIQFIASSAPHGIIMMIAILDFQIFTILAGIVVMGIFYAPVFAVAIYVKSKF